MISDNFLENLFTLEDGYIFLSMAISLIGLYFVFSRIIKKSRMQNDQKRRFLGNARAFMLFCLITTTLVIWSTELYQFVISIAALMAGFAIASKEVLLCLGGSFYKAFARPFTVGDRIEINGIRGDVVDVGLMGTQLLEVGPKDYTQQLTGRLITIPNSQFLAFEVFNETDSVTEHRDFVLHIIKVPIELNESWEVKRDLLLQCAQDICQQYIEAAAKFFKRLSKKRQVDSPLIEPRINLKFDTPDNIFLVLRVCVPVDKRGTIEQEILRSYLKQTYNN